jgi:hypothetical protein
MSKRAFTKIAEGLDEALQMARGPARKPKPTFAPVFVSGDTAAALCEISRETWDTWVRAGYVPRPHVERGQILRWHWPSVEEALAAGSPPVHVDPSVQGVANVQKGRHRAVA